MGKSFLEIAPRRASVTIGEDAFQLRPLSLADLSAFALRFEPFKTLMDGGGLKARDLISCGSELVGAVIAAALDKPGDAAFEAQASNLPMTDQFAVVKKIYEMSFPAEVRGPFDAMLAMAFEGFNTSLERARSQQAPSSASTDPIKS
jgi:hypothetical protein